MKNWAIRLIDKYPNRKLAENFFRLPQQIITMLPMAFCDSLTQDLKKTCDDEILAAIGLNSFLISTHDDVVDEMPKNRKIVSGLVYAGNIAALEGMKILFEKNRKKVAQALIDSVNKNHYLQQLVVEKLWQGKKINAKEYFDGIKHIGIFSAIGPLCALALTGRNDLKKTILKFASNYGITLQLIDDIRETEEDKIAGYSSLPLTEGTPFTCSFAKLYQHAKIARSALDKKWERMTFYVDAIDQFARKIEKEINEKR